MPQLRIFSTQSILEGHDAHCCDGFAPGAAESLLCESSRGLSPARIVEVVTGEGRAPVRENTHEAASGKLRSYLLLR